MTYLEYLKPEVERLKVRPFDFLGVYIPMSADMKRKKEIWE